VRESYDAIVVGLGAAGSATAYQLARRGRRVLGLDQFGPGHNQGSSHGYHRMIRRSSTQDDGYVPLGERAFELWDEVAAEAGRQLLWLTGEIRIVDADHNPRFRATAEAMQRRGFWEILDDAALRERFPGVRPRDGMLFTHEATAGFLLAEGGVIAHLDLAARHGAEIHHDEEVIGWATDGDGVRVTTARGEYRAGQLIITTGSWAPELLRDLDLPLKVIRTVNGYFTPTRPDHWSLDRRAPDFLLDVPEGDFYGMPGVAGVGLKIGRSRLIDGPATTARTIDRSIREEEIALLRDVLDRYMPGACGPEVRRITCLEAYTADDHFIIDRHPAHPQILIGCGFSGRGFKFGPTTGEILADLAVDGRTRHDIGFLSATRFAPAAAR
jgi:sarcosine oxidase